MANRPKTREVWRLGPYLAPENAAEMFYGWAKVKAPNATESDFSKFEPTIDDPHGFPFKWGYAATIEVDIEKIPEEELCEDESDQIVTFVRLVEETPCFDTTFKIRILNRDRFRGWYSIFDAQNRNTYTGGGATFVVDDNLAPEMTRFYESPEDFVIHFHVPSSNPAGPFPITTVEASYDFY
eukprot:TRINITY_DN11124_c0_g1_i2.p1 TRINITY_DN11124_c0_g1~~TRINITY_DN11124_c0_g1_i2.p1  ORF type:complete len:182 (-),score=7.33 TRINITY_DN11124_c0_g1_i2:112-657(-)